jgi:hypothetical protein
MNTQVLRLNRQADLIHSHGQLLPRHSSCLPKDWLVVQSAWSAILKLQPGGTPLLIPLVHRPCQDLQGYYDLAFSCISAAPWECQLIISCRTVEAKARQQFNQAINESSLDQSSVSLPT